MVTLENSGSDPTWTLGGVAVVGALTAGIGVGIRKRASDDPAPAAIDRRRGLGALAEGVGLVLGAVGGFTASIWLTEEESAVVTYLSAAVVGAAGFFAGRWLVERLDRGR